MKVRCDFDSYSVRQRVLQSRKLFSWKKNWSTWNPSARARDRIDRWLGKKGIQVLVLGHGKSYPKTRLQRLPKYNCLLLDEMKSALPDVRINLCNPNHLTALSDTIGLVDVVSYEYLPWDVIHCTHFIDFVRKCVRQNGKILKQN